MRPEMISATACSRTHIHGVLCSWGQRVYDRIGNTAYTGVDDTKLFVWPGKGLFSITGRHQELVNTTDPICRGFNWMQYLLNTGQCAAGSNRKLGTHLLILLGGAVCGTGGCV